MYIARPVEAGRFAGRRFQRGARRQEAVDAARPPRRREHLVRGFHTDRAVRVRPVRTANGKRICAGTGGAKNHMLVLRTPTSSSPRFVVNAGLRFGR